MMSIAYLLCLFLARLRFLFLVAVVGGCTTAEIVGDVPLMIRADYGGGEAALPQTLAKSYPVPQPSRAANSHAVRSNCQIQNCESSPVDGSSPAAVTDPINDFRSFWWNAEYDPNPILRGGTAVPWTQDGAFLIGADQMAAVADWNLDIGMVIDAIHTATVAAVSQAAPDSKSEVPPMADATKDSKLTATPVKACASAKCELPPIMDGSPLEQVIASLVAAEPGAVLKSMIKIGHLLGIVLGLGSATVLDLVMIRFFIASEIQLHHLPVVEFMSKIVILGLALLWISGALYIIHYLTYNPEKIYNQKVWAKIAIVVVLSINGYFIHRCVIPLIKAQVGGGLFRGLSPSQRFSILAFGVISGTSWYVPLMLGALPHLNFVVPATSILFLYATLLLVAIAVANSAANRLIGSGDDDPEARHRYQLLMDRVSRTLGSGRGPARAISPA